VISFVARLALETLATTDATYHDVHHTMMVTLVGEEILRGRHISVGMRFSVRPSTACFRHSAVERRWQGFIE